MRVWSTDAIYNADDPSSLSKPKQLASMSYHAGTIHTVRFSSNGQYIASGADDKMVIVYRLDKNAVLPEITFGRNQDAETCARLTARVRLKRDSPSRSLEGPSTVDWP